MDQNQYRVALQSLGLTAYTAPKYLGISLRQSMRYAAGDSPIKLSVALLLDAYQQIGLPSPIALARHASQARGAHPSIT